MELNTELLRQQEKAKKFKELHHNGKLLILPNIWDSLGALLLQSLEYPAIATASASIAFTNGYDDGENVPFELMLSSIERIAASVHVPVTADIESGYAGDEIALERNIRQLLKTGIAGINLEDTDKKINTLLPVEVQAQKISFIKKIASDAGIDLFINARTDVYINDKKSGNEEVRLNDAMDRGIAYKAAGADCFYPIGIQNEEHIKQIVKQLGMPVNVLMIPGIPALNILHEHGVARVSLGPSFLKIAIKAMKEIALQLKFSEGMASITGNEITSDYLRTLISGGNR